MTILEFQEKLTGLRAKCGMREDVMWPIVYDEDEIGEILVCEDGKICFADKMSNWLDSHLTMQDVSNIRYKSVETATRSDRDIFINFSTGDYIKMHNWKKNSVVYASATMLRTEENAEFVDQLKERCECYDNIRGNTFYVSIRKPGK